jgi:hypothetical protein
LKGRILQAAKKMMIAAYERKAFGCGSPFVFAGFFAGLKSPAPANSKASKSQSEGKSRQRQQQQNQKQNAGVLPHSTLLRVRMTGERGSNCIEEARATA